MNVIDRKSLLYKTDVEYGDYTINHVEGCSHGCLYPCYAMMLKKRFGVIKDYADWLEPKIVGNALALLEKEIPKYKSKIKHVHLCFTTDPFMYNYKEICDLSIAIIKRLNESEIKCTALTKGVLPEELMHLGNQNEYGITLISLKEEFRKEYEPYAAPYFERINSLYKLHKAGIKTWVSIEPYPTPNIVDQNFSEILNAIDFVDKIIYGRLNYNSQVTKYPGYKEFFNELSNEVIEFCKKNNKEYHIKEGTITVCKAI
ncbi:radical SAM protein [Lutispora sp.]|uniref:radical SAM protein n=1 Tax=Lutispora sp. TaxID=2828727 RepID=UPI003563ADCD